MKKNILLIVAIFIITLCYGLAIFLTCKSYTSINFDSQNLLFWDYAAINGYQAHKDVFYPYGMIEYLKDKSLFILIAQTVTLTVVSIAFVIFIKRIIRNTFAQVLITVFLTIFLFVFIGLDTFMRYGSTIGLGLLIMTYYFDSKKQKIPVLLIFGIASGILFSLFVDQGVYSVILLGCIIFGYQGILNYLHRRQLFHGLPGVFVRCFILILGFIVGSLPLLIVYSNEHILLSFVQSFSSYADMADYARSPFFPSLKSSEGLFVFVSIIIASIVILAGIIRRKLLIIDYYVIVIFISLMLFMQKNIMRSINNQLTFVALLIVIVLLVKVANQATIKRYKKIFWIFCFTIPFVLIGYGYHFNIQKFTYRNIYLDRDVLAFSKDRTCFVQNFLILRSRGELDTYEKVISEVQLLESFNGRLFSFPADPVFYILLKQKLPRYSNLYDASSLAAQQTLIEYIEDNDINIVVINGSVGAIQDGVPDVVRGSYLYSYILSNYGIEKVVGDFLIMTRRANADFDIFKEYISDPQAKIYLQSMQHISLGNIPISEAKYKLSEAKNDLNVGTLVVGDKTKLSKYLVDNQVMSERLFLHIKSTDGEDNTTTTITRWDGVNTVISHDSCTREKGCLIRLSKIPIFYKTNRLRSVETSIEQSTIRLIKINNTSTFW